VSAWPIAVVVAILAENHGRGADTGFSDISWDD
jgi:hypothetical protein